MEHCQQGDAGRVQLGTPGRAADTVGYSVSLSVRSLWNVAKRSVTAIVEIFKPKQRKELHSVVGAYAIAANQIASGWVNGVWIIAEISLGLAIINLFPFLPLDGGHIFWAAAEKLRGGRISIVVIERASIVGIALIAILLFVIGLSNDISTLAGSGLQLSDQPLARPASIERASTSIG